MNLTRETITVELDSFGIVHTPREEINHKWLLEPSLGYHECLLHQAKQVVIVRGDLVSIGNVQNHSSRVPDQL